jgi:hypothetical protein
MIVINYATSQLTDISPRFRIFLGATKVVPSGSQAGMMLEQFRNPPTGLICYLVADAIYLRGSA